MKKRISISKYNELYHIAENVLQQSWLDLGLSEKEIIKRSNKNKELVKLAKKNGFDPVYNLYKKNANDIVDKILLALLIEVLDSNK